MTDPITVYRAWFDGDYLGKTTDAAEVEFVARSKRSKVTAETGHFQDTRTGQTGDYGVSMEQTA